MKKSRTVIVNKPLTLGPSELPTSAGKLPDSYWKEAFAKICRYSKNVGYEVFITDSPDYVEIDDKEIYINRRSTPERKVYSILHELGHVVINENHQSFSSGLGYVLRNFQKKMTQWHIFKT